MTALGGARSNVDRLDAAPLEPFRDGFGARACIELAEQRLDVKLHGVLRDLEAPRDGLVAETRRDRREYLELARSDQRRARALTGVEASVVFRGTHDQPRRGRAQRRVDLRVARAARQLPRLLHVV